MQDIQHTNTPIPTHSLSLLNLQTLHSLSLLLGDLLELAQGILYLLNLALQIIILLTIDGYPADIVLVFAPVADVVLQAALVHLVLVLQAVQVEDVVPQEVVAADVHLELYVRFLELR